MRWVTVIMMGALMSGCATGPVVTHRQVAAPNQYEIDRYNHPVITHKKLSGNQFEITVKSRPDQCFLEGCLAFSKYGNKLCEEETGFRFLKTKKPSFVTGSNNPIWTQVSIIECLPKGSWVKQNGDPSERKKDFYECNKDSRLFFDPQMASAVNVCQQAEISTRSWDFFEYCLQSKGYEFVETPKEEGLKTSVPQPSLGINWDFLVESKTGDSKLYLDWNSVRWDYDGVRWGNDVMFRVKAEYTNGIYVILTFKYYCTKKNYVVVHGAAYNQKNQLIEDKSYFDDNLPKSIAADVMGDLYEILCEPLLNRKKEK